MKALLIITFIASVLSAGCFLNITSYTASDGSTIYVGDYYDEQSGPGFYRAEIQGKVYDANGGLVDTAGGFLCGGVYHGGIIPFKAWTGPGTVPARIDWSVIDEQFDPLLATGLEVRVTNTFVAGDQTYIVGELTNTSSNDYLASTICISFTDAEGRVVRSGWNNGGAWKFDSGDTLPFSVPIDTPPRGSDIHFYLDAQVDNPGKAVDIPGTSFSHNFQQTVAHGDLFVTTGMGEVRNVSDKPLYPDSVVTVTDSAGKLLATRGDPSDCGVTIAPGASGFVTYTVKAGVNTRPVARLQGVEQANQIYFPDLTDVTFGTRSDPHTITVTGTVTNTSAVVLKFVDVCAGGYDGAGIVRAVGSTGLDLPERGLAPGASAPFSITMPDGGGVARVRALADGFAE